MKTKNDIFKTEEKVITLGLYKALGIVATAILISGVGGAFLAYRTLNTDHFTLIAVASSVTSIQTKLATDELLIPQFAISQNDIQTIKGQLAGLTSLEQDNNSKLNQILGELSSKNNKN